MKYTQRTHTKTNREYSKVFLEIYFSFGKAHMCAPEYVQCSASLKFPNAKVSNVPTVSLRTTTHLTSTF